MSEPTRALVSWDHPDVEIRTIGALLHVVELAKLDGLDPAGLPRIREYLDSRLRSLSKELAPPPPKEGG